MRTVELEGVDNVRDLGGIPVEGSRHVKPGIIFRGSHLMHPTDNDLETMFGELGIACVVDVRCGWEREAKPDVEIPGVENLHIPFYDLEKVGIEYTEPAAGTKTVGRDIACNPVPFYRSLANPLTVGQMRKGIDAVFSHVMQSKPVFIHCSGGKDRAGIMALLVLTVLGASEEAILEDYLMTNLSRDKNYDKVYARFLRLADGNEQRARELVESHRALPGNLAAFREEIDERYHGMDAFVRNQLGITDDRKTELRSLCTE